MSTKNTNPGGDESKVGYGKPPIHSQFKPGHSGNPNGRPKKSGSIRKLVLDELDQKVTIREGSRTIKVSKSKAIAKQIVAQAAKGNMKALQQIMAIQRSTEPEDENQVTWADLAEELDRAERQEKLDLQKKKKKRAAKRRQRKKKG